MLMEHFKKFNNLNKKDQILNIDAKSFEKVPPPELSEIEENESDSISTNSVTFLMTLRRRTKT